MVSSNGNSTAQKFGYNGKELSEELGLDWHDFGARNYNASLGRWMNLDPHSDTYMSLSPYNSFANNPISFIDPDGKDILFWQKNKEGEWKQVEFSQLNKDTQKAVEAFAKTKEGNSFLKDFANEGDKIGEVEFGEDGKYSKHELAVGEFSQYYGVQGASGVKNKKGDGKLTLELAVNTTGDYDHSRVAQMANVIGHESFVHLSQYVSNLIEAFDSGDMKQVEKLLNDRKSFAGKFKTGEHSGYVKGSKDFKRMRAYISQLKGVLNPKEVEKAKQQDVKHLNNMEINNKNILTFLIYSLLFISCKKEITERDIIKDFTYNIYNESGLIGLEKLKVTKNKKERVDSIIRYSKEMIIQDTVVNKI